LFHSRKCFILERAVSYQNRIEIIQKLCMLNHMVPNLKSEVRVESGENRDNEKLVDWEKVF